jgi:hypothetical protein
MNGNGCKDTAQAKAWTPNKGGRSLVYMDNNKGPA